MIGRVRDFIRSETRGETPSSHELRLLDFRSTQDSRTIIRQRCSNVSVRWSATSRWHGSCRRMVGMRTTTVEPEVFKVDRRGRVHVSAARREALLDEFERSGASAPEFTRLVGVKYATFAGWWAKRRRQRGVSLAPPPAPGGLERPGRAPVPLFAEVVEPPAVAAAQEGLAMELPGGGRLWITRATHVPWVADLLGRLSPAGCRPC